MLKLACADVMIPGNSWTEKAEKIRELGFVGMSIFTPRDGFGSSELEELQNLEKKTEIKPVEFVFSSDMYGKLMDTDQRVRDKAFSLYAETIEVCASIGALTEMEYEYRTQDQLPLFDPYPPIPAEEEKQLAGIMEQLCLLSGNKKVPILLEPCNRYECRYIKQISDAKKILKMVPCDNAGILADTFHLSIEESNLSASILDSGSLIKHVHLGDNNRLLPGQGSLPWKSILSAFKQINYQGYMALECGINGDPMVELNKFASDFQKLWMTV